MGHSEKVCQSKDPEQHRRRLKLSTGEEKGTGEAVQSQKRMHGRWIRGKKGERADRGEFELKGHPQPLSFNKTLLLTSRTERGGMKGGSTSAKKKTETFGL